MQFKNLNELKTALTSRYEDVIACKLNNTKNLVAGVNFITKVEAKGEDTEDVIYRKIVGNVAHYLDKDNDILTAESWKKSTERKHKMRLLKDHNYSMDSILGNITGLSTENIAYEKLGIEGNGTAAALVAEVEIRREYDEKLFSMYKNYDVDQHSIGFRGIKGGFGFNDPSNSEEYLRWVKHIDKIINRSVALSKGYFWVYEEIQLYEISGVVFGANEKTPTLQPKAEPPKHSKQHPQQSTDNRIKFYQTLLTRK